MIPIVQSGAGLAIFSKIAVERFEIMDKYKERFEAEWEKYRENKENTYPNIMLLGTSGAGKSSLINTVFGRELASVSDVEPETRGYDTIYWGKDYGNTVNLIDTAGYELDQGESYYFEVRKVISEGIKEEPIHIIWYCVPVTNERVQEMDVDILRRLMEEPGIRKRICVVFTKCDQDTEEGMKAKVLKQIIADKVPFQVKSFETSNVKGLGLELTDLIEWSANAIENEDLREKFIASQMADLEQKRSYAGKIIATATATAAGIGAVPIPFSDAVLLVPVQVAMISKIIDGYGVSSLANISEAVISDIVVTNLGKSIVSGILKVIPGIGSLVGGMISAGVAGTLTGAVGFAVSEICYNSVKKFFEGKPVDWTNLFESEEFSQKVAGAFKMEK